MSCRSLLSTQGCYLFNKITGVRIITDNIETTIDEKALKESGVDCTQPSNKCERHLLSMIHKASRQIEVFLDNTFQNDSISAREAHLLGYVNVYGPCSVSELIRVFGLKASTLTSMLDRLEHAEYIHRKPNPDDRRSLLLHISEKGTDKACHAYKVTDEMAQDIKAHVTQEDLAGFEAVMSAIDKVTNIKLR